jgi:16S rRNA G966 N2-methylase RsmD
VLHLEDSLAFTRRAGSLASRGLRALRRLGPAGFASLVGQNVQLLLSGRSHEHRFVYDDAWDRAHGVDTAGTVAVCEIDAPVAAKADAARYEPTPPECFSFLVEQALPADRAGYSFIDLGSGKGRVAMLAALAGFRKVVAVEFGADLHAAAAENFRRFAAAREAAPIAAVHGDARCHCWEMEPTVCFLNNPFSGEVLDSVLDSIERSLSEVPRPFVLIYYHCDHVDRLDRREGWQACGRGHWRSESHHYALFSWRGAGR